MPYRNTPYHINAQGGISGLENVGGNTFYVAASGYTAADGVGASDSNDGLSPQTPLSTIQAALNLCVTGRGDTVAILPGSITVTAALTMTKDDVTLKGAINAGPRAYQPAVIVNATNVNTLTIDANNCKVENITFDDNVSTAGADTAVIAVNSVSSAADYTGTVLRNLYLDMAGADDDRDGITLGLAGDTTDGALKSLVEGCVIWDCGQDAIVIAAGSENCIVRDCLISDDGTITTRYGVEAVALSAHIDACTIMSSGTACINNGIAAARLMVTNCTLSAWGANTIGIVAINTATQHTMNNWIAAAAAGNIIDYATSSTTPSADVAFGNVTGTNPAATTAVTPTVGGS